MIDVRPNENAEEAQRIEAAFQRCFDNAVGAYVDAYDALQSWERRCDDGDPTIEWTEYEELCARWAERLLVVLQIKAIARSMIQFVAQPVFYHPRGSLALSDAINQRERV